MWDVLSAFAVAIDPPLIYTPRHNVFRANKETTVRQRSPNSPEVSFIVYREQCAQ